MSKKIMALVLALAMVFSTITVAFAEEPVAEAVAEEVAEVAEVSAEAKALGTIGMLEGAGDGLTAEYTATELNRLTAAIMILKLKGLYEDALKYDGVNNFVDAEELKWEDGKKVLAYLKDNPTVGFGGNEKGEFNPNGTLSEQMLYKVLLENLGYKQVTADVADGDFAWEETLEFAEELGLKPAKAEKFTVDGLAKAVTAALKTDMKDGKAWIEVLVESGKVDEGKAVAAGLMEEAPVVTAALKSAKAIGNTVVEVTFDAEINEGAEDLALYAIEGLEIKDAIIAGEKVVNLETSAQTAGKTYTLVVGEVKYNFGGKAKVSGAPELKKVTGPDTERVELEFDKALDFASATDVANYAINGVTIEKAELDVDTVTLTTSGLAPNKTHTIKVTNVKSVDGVALKSASKSFYSKSDKVAPKVDKAESKTYTRVLVSFNEELDKESAENVENYTVKDLTIEKAVYLGENDDTSKFEVELTTSAQKAGTSYSLKVKGIKDASVLGNEIVKEQTAKFTGKTQDKTGPTVPNVEVKNRNRVLVTFNDNSRLDFATVQDIANYEFDKDITVEKAEMLPGFDDDTKQVILTVSDMAEKTYYKLTITGVTDEYGNEMKKVEKSVNYTNAKLNAAKITKINSKSATEIEVLFDNHIDPVTAKDVANYSINGDIGTPISAKINSALTKVTLKINEQVEGKTYKLTVDGVMDLAGNTLNTSASFVARTLENDIEAPEIEDITVVNKYVMRVAFSEAIEISGGESVDITKADGTGLKTLNIGAVYDGNKVLEFSSSGFTFQELEYTLKTFNGTIADKAGNATVVGDDINFWGNTYDADDIDFSWEQVNVEKYKLTFSEKVKLDTVNGSYNASMVDDDADVLGMDTVWFFTRKVAINKVAFKGDINREFDSGHVGVNIANTSEEKDGETIITATLEDTDAPYIESVKAVYRNEVEVIFNEDIRPTAKGAYEISYYDLAGKLKKYTFSGSELALDENVITIKLGTKLALESRFDYTLKVITVAQDLAGNKSELNEEYGFQGTDLVAAGNYITGVEIINGTTFNIRLNEKITTAVAELKLGTATIATTTADNITPPATTSNKFTVTLTNDVLQYGKDYVVTLGGMEYKFKGTVESGLSVEVDTTGAKPVITVSYDGALSTDTVTVNSGTVVANTSVTPAASIPGTYVPANENFTATLAAGDLLFNVVVKRGTVTLYTYEHEDNNQAAADVVITLINEIPASNDTGFATAVGKASTEYNTNLTVVQKSLVSNYSALVAAEGVVDEQDVVADKADVNVTYTAGDTVDSVKSNVTLVNPATKGSTITWTSSNPAIVGVDGTVTRSATDNINDVVTLTATITKGTASDTKIFTLTVIEAKAAVATGDFTNVDSKIVVVTFDEAMDPTTLVKTNFSSTEGGVITAFSAADDNKSVTITFTNDLAAGNTVVIAPAVTDANGNASGQTLTK